MSERASYRCVLRYRRWIDRAFVHGLRPARWRRLAAHLRTCASCRARYDRLAHVSQALSPSAHTSGDMPVDMPMDMPMDMIDRIGARLAAESADTAAAPRKPWGWLGAGMGAAVAAAAVLLLVSGPDARHQTGQTEAPLGAEGTLRPRGHGSAPAGLVPGQRQPGLRMFCIAADGDGAYVVDEARATTFAIETEPLRCARENELQLAYSTPRLPGIHMVAFGLDGAGQTYWYAPRFAGEPAVALRADAIDEPLDWTTRLEVRHNPGIYDLHVLFFERAVMAEEAAGNTSAPLYELHGRVEIIDGSTEEP